MILQGLLTVPRWTPRWAPRCLGYIWPASRPAVRLSRRLLADYPNYTGGRRSAQQTASNSVQQLDTGPNITNALNEINNENAFKFLRDSEQAESHDLFNIERYEKNLAKATAQEKARGDKIQAAADHVGSDSTAKSGDVASGGSEVDGPDSIYDVVKVDSFLDTHQLVDELHKGGFTDAQAETVMNVTRAALKRRLNWLTSELSPKVDLENEEYLFQAAHNELLVEVTNSREIALMNLQNSSMILKRKFSNLQDETSTKIKLNDDMIKMQLSQFKHENNLQQRSLEIKNNDLNNRIISELMSGLRSTIENFRWQLTCGGIFAIMTMATLLLGGWRVGERKRKAKEAAAVSEPLPELSYRHRPADEETHDYEADWDENVEVN